MPRLGWIDLPVAVRTAIESQCGPVASAVSPDAGRSSGLSVTLHTGGGQVVFCKGVDLSTHRSRMHRHEPGWPRICQRWRRGCCAATSMYPVGMPAWNRAHRIYRSLPRPWPPSAASSTRARVEPGVRRSAHLGRDRHPRYLGVHAASRAGPAPTPAGHRGPPVGELPTADSAGASVSST